MKTIKKHLFDYKGTTNGVTVKEIKNEKDQGEWRQIYEKDENGVSIGGKYEYKWFPKSIEEPNMAFTGTVQGTTLRVVANLKLSERGKTKKVLINIDLGSLKEVVSELYHEDK